MRVISLSNAGSLTLGGATYEPGPDGVFDFPEPVGVELTTKHASMWVAEAVHLAATTAAEIDKLRDPNHMVSVVADLLGRVASLEAKHAAASKPKAPKAETPPPAPAASEEPKLTAAQKRAAAKKTTPSKPKAAATQDPAAEDAAPETESAGQPEAPAEPTADDIKLRDDASA